MSVINFHFLGPNHSYVASVTQVPGSGHSIEPSDVALYVIFSLATKILYLRYFIIIVSECLHRGLSGMRVVPRNLSYPIFVVTTSCAIHADGPARMTAEFWPRAKL
jgi:hypothetical protein